MKQLKYFQNLCLAFTLHLMFVLVTMKEPKQLAMHNIGISMCQTKCMEYGFCRSIAYNGNNLTCHLSSEVRKLGKRNGFTVLRVGYDVRKGTCSSEAGGPIMRCLQTRSGKYASVQENVANDRVDVTPPVVKSTCPSSVTAKGKGSDDSCKTGKFLCGSKSKPQCCHSWKWTRPGKTCFGTTWKKTNGKVHQPPRRNLKEEFRLSMTARFISGRGRQSVNLDFRDDSTLHFGVDISKRKTVLALFYNHRMQRVLKVATFFPFRNNRKFNTDIIKQNAAYKVLIDGRLLLKTRDTFPRTGPYMISVNKMHRNVKPEEIKIRNYATRPCC